MALVVEEILMATDAIEGGPVFGARALYLASAASHRLRRNATKACSLRLSCESPR